MADTIPVLQLGDPKLRARSQPVSFVQDASVQTLIDQLLATVHDSNGVGIAAPQVGKNLRLLIVASRPNLRYPDAPAMAPTPMINPQIVSHSAEQVKGWEGCLSVPGIRGLVPRYRQIEVGYLDRTGQPQQQVLTDFVARIFQHEYDHLEGHVFLDRVDSTQDLISEAEYQKRVIDALPCTQPAADTA
ncbi:MAG: peptide deformylase [Leptolyngbya sp. SIO4C1]|nr:peptide deformylase [Leptolyngbya sp. SIO4C1]